jgi:iron complex outermembrane receptor protein
VIQVVTRRAAGPSARLETGSFGSAALALGHGVSLGATQLDMGAELRRSSGHRAGTDYRIGMGRTALSAPLAGRTLRADLGYAARDFGADAFYAPFPSYEETRALAASVGWAAEGESRFSVEPRVSLRRHHDDFTLKRADPAFYRNQHLTQQLGGELMARFAAAPLLRLAGGVEAYQDRLRSATLGDRAEGRSALFAEAAAGRVGHATATAGMRADWHEAFGWFTSPSAAAAWWPGAGVRLRGSLGRALRTPTWTERYYRDPANIGNPDLMPERAWSGEVGADAYPLAGVRLGVAGFVRSADHLIDWTKPASTPKAPWETRNVEDAQFRGLESEAGIDELLGVRWTLRGSWLSVRSSEAEGFTSKYALRPLTESVSLVAERGRRLGSPAYLRLDLRTAYQLKGLRFFADLQNASGETYFDITGSAAPGRALFVGIEWRG